MTAELVREELDVTSPDRIAEWERAFFQGFAQVTSNRLIRTLWIWNEAERRLATRIPYADQVIYCWRDATGEIVSSIAANVRMERFQSAAFGFAPLTGGPPACELLAAFNLYDRDLAHVIRVRNSALADLYSRGYRIAYLTTADGVYHLWIRCGAKVLGEALIEGERRRFLQFALSPSGVPLPP